MDARISLSSQITEAGYPDLELSDIYGKNYFASDIHLGAGGGRLRNQTERRFVRWLDDAAQDAGDFPGGRRLRLLVRIPGRGAQGLRGRPANWPN